MLDILHSDFIRTARAKGVSNRAVVLCHALPNALLPVVTQIGLDLGNLLSGVLIVEVVFGWPGIGNWAWSAVQNLDYPIVLGTVFVSAVLISLCNLERPAIGRRDREQTARTGRAPAIMAYPRP
jgi:peptide/nickel transport system permease protein